MRETMYGIGRFV